MLSLSRRNGLLFIMLLGFFGSGLLIWPVSYENLALASRLFLVSWLVAALAAGVLGRLVTRQSIWGTSAAVGIGFVAAIFSRVVMDWAKDPATHNLFALEAVLALLVGVSGAFVGATVTAQVQGKSDG